MFDDIYKNRRVLITGDTGFKGSWLRFWLEKMGAKVRGYSLKPNDGLNHFSLLGFTRESSENIVDLPHLKEVFDDFKPEIVFHLAAQALVRLSYQQPMETFADNVMGTVNLLECSRLTPTVQATVIITSDKCYQNREQIWGYREDDPMGGFDPYSASKGCAELVTSAYRNSFFEALGKRLASARAGNVIGGGDWAADRLVPDLMRAAAAGSVTKIRNPLATRPWQHVLEPLSGYLWLGKQLFCADKEDERRKLSSGWNFGPADGVRNVMFCAQQLQKYWDKIQFEMECESNWHEAQSLTLDITCARHLLGWQPVWNLETTLERTVRWYRNFYEQKNVSTEDDWNQYLADAQKEGCLWIR